MLTDTIIRRTKPTEKTQYLKDGIKGLRLEVRPNGSKLWRLRYTVAGKERLASLGKYPDVGLSQVRDKARAFQAEVAEGKDVIVERKRERAGGTSVKEVGKMWFETKSAHWSPDHSKRVLLRLNNDVYPEIGSMHVGKVTPPDALRVANRLVKRGAIKSAKEVMGYVGGICRHGIGLGLAEQDPTVHLKGVIQRPPKPEHFAALLDPTEIGEFLSKLSAVENSLISRTALWTAIYTWQRIGTVLQMRWDHVDLDKGLWLVTPDQNKTGVEMYIPLPSQLVAMLRELPRTAPEVFVYRGRVVTPQVTQKLVGRLGYRGRVTTHGWRAVGRTVGAETLGYPPHVCETQLLHQTERLGASYNRTSYLDERVKLVQDYADYLDAIRKDIPA